MLKIYQTNCLYHSTCLAGYTHLRPNFNNVITSSPTRILYDGCNRYVSLQWCSHSLSRGGLCSHSLSRYDEWCSHSLSHDECCSHSVFRYEMNSCCVLCDFSQADHYDFHHNTTDLKIVLLIIVKYM